jgi:hypothetical protein
MRARNRRYYPFTFNSKNYDCVYAGGDLAYDIYMGADTRDDYTNSLNYLSNEANKNGWNLASCGLKFYYICEAPASVFPCYPPPSPPLPPPLPPSPPSPPMPPTCERSPRQLPARRARRAGPSLTLSRVTRLTTSSCALCHCAGAPPANASFFCDAGSQQCYMYVQEPLAQANASAYCARHGGNLVTYRTAAKQVLIENYFDLGPLTDYYYWIGLKRATAADPFEFTSGSPNVSQAAANAPYAHWSWYHPIAQRAPNYDCAIAQQAFRYELYLGDTNVTSQQGIAHQADSRFYNTNPQNKELAYGWNAYPCPAKLHFVCEVPASAFPCFPPPPPPNAPGAPPPPPSPPRPQIGMGTGGSGSGNGDCEWRRGLRRAHAPAADAGACLRLQAVTAAPNSWLPPRPARAGAPANNATFVSNAQGSMYYSYVAARANFTQAAASCRAMNGSLVTWKDGASQYSVEHYFHAAKVLGKYYWQGISRARPGAAFAYIDGSSAGQTVSNIRPYAHWCAPWRLQLRRCAGHAPPLLHQAARCPRCALRRLLQGLDPANLQPGRRLQLRAGLEGPGVRRLQGQGHQPHLHHQHEQLQHRPALRRLQIRLDRVRLRRRLPLRLPAQARGLPLHAAAQPALAAAATAVAAVAADGAVL